MSKQFDVDRFVEAQFLSLQRHGFDVTRARSTILSCCGKDPMVAAGVDRLFHAGREKPRVPAALAVAERGVRREGVERFSPAR